VLKAFKIAVLGGILTSLSENVLLCAAQSADVASPAPVPAQIRTAKKVFISDLGSDAISASVFLKEGEVDKP
jgi:hypothetical protein